MTRTTLAAALGVVCLVAAAAVPALADSVIPDYQFMLVSGKPGVIPGPNPGSGVQTLGVTNDGEYLAAQLKFGSYTAGIQFYHRNDVTPYDDYQSLDSAVGDVVGNNSNSVPGNATDNTGGPNAGNDARVGAATGPFTGTRAWSPGGRMTHENYFVFASGSSQGPYQEWQPQELAAGATQNTYQINTADSVAVMHTTTPNDYWGIGGYNKKGSIYVETLNAGQANEVIRGLTYGTHYSSGAWGAGMFEVGPWTAPADPLTQRGTRSKVSAQFFMNATQLADLVPGVNDAFRSWFSDGQYVFFLTGGAGDDLSYLTAVEITNWSTGAWTQVEVASGGGMYQSFTFNSGSGVTSLLDAVGIAFAPNPAGGSPLLYLSDGRRIFVLESAAVPLIPEPAGLSLVGLALLGLRRRRS